MEQPAWSAWSVDRENNTGHSTQLNNRARESFQLGASGL